MHILLSLVQTILPSTYSGCEVDEVITYFPIVHRVFPVMHIGVYISFETLIPSLFIITAQKAEHGKKQNRASNVVSFS